MRATSVLVCNMASHAERDLGQVVRVGAALLIATLCSGMFSCSATERTFPHRANGATAGNAGNGASSLFGAGGAGSGDTSGNEPPPGLGSGGAAAIGCVPGSKKCDPT